MVHVTTTQQNHTCISAVPTMSDSEAFQWLSDVLRTHGAQPDMTALKAAFQKGPEAAAWVQRHLTADTLLSRDELDQ